MVNVRPFRRLWLVLGFSSLGDWLGLLATALFAANQVTGSTAQGLAFGSVIAVRLMPALFFGTLGGIIADRFDRRLTMVVCDVLRFGLFASIPLVALLVDRGVTAVAWVGIANFLIECAALVWMPAKEASVPNLLPKARLEKANQLTLATTYGLTPVIAAAVLGALTSVAGAALIEPISHIADPIDLAIYFNALTFLFVAIVVLFGIKEISGRDGNHKAAAAASGGLVRQFVDGWRYVATRPLVRGLVFGILGAFVGGGVVIGTAKFYAISVGGGDAAFSLLFAVLFVGLGLGIVAGPRMVGALSRRRWFGISIVLAGAATLLLAVAPHLSIGAAGALLVGVGAGMAFLAGITLLGTEVPDDVRGRVFAFVNTASRAVLMLAISLSSVLVGFGSSRHVDIGPVNFDISTTRVLLLIAGGVGIVTGLTAFRQMDDKPGVNVFADIWSSALGRPLGLPEGRGGGLFVVFEGGEGAGKSTQAIKLAAWLQVHDREAVLTREPGATDVGARIRAMLLERNALPTGESLTPRAEALLYAADRAHHVSTVVRPALARGAVVISDRYVDSSLAYQGAGRVLPVEEVAWLSRWATGNLKPDLVVLLDVEPAVGLKRVAGRGAADRLETESVAFHERVRYAFLDLAAAEPRRYLVVDAGVDQDEIAERVRERVLSLLPSIQPGPPEDLDASDLGAAEERVSAERGDAQEAVAPDVAESSDGPNGRPDSGDTPDGHGAEPDSATGSEERHEAGVAGERRIR
ncbi:MAG: dTMP kinase [Micromonosporaceae bacterium]|nr:dTMP kinase [Micromonosporaceae bacterium]